MREMERDGFGLLAFFEMAADASAENQPVAVPLSETRRLVAK